MLAIAREDPTRADVTALIARHLAGMHENTPAESVHALDLSALQHPDVAFWTARVGGRLAGIAATARLDDANAFLGRGVGRALVRRIVADARERGVAALWLETGSGDDFVAARRLYASEGFVECPPFGSYRPDPNSTFMTLGLQPSA
jgi:putative acetyltransferase